MNNQDISRQFIVRSIVLLFVVAPAIGFFAAALLNNQSTQDSLNPEERSSQQLLAATKQGLNEFDTQLIYTNMSLSSKQRFENIWYLVLVKGEYKDGDKTAEETAPAIIGDFRNTDKKLTLVVPPGGDLQYSDISESMGMPYELIAKFNELKEES